MKDILNYLIEYKTLTQSQAKNALKKIAGGEFNQSQMAAFLTVFLMRTAR